MGNLPNNYGRPKLVERYSSLFDFFSNYVLPEKDRLLRFQEDDCKKRKILEKAEGVTEAQRRKVERAYELQEHFKR